MKDDILQLQKAILEKGKSPIAKYKELVIGLNDNLFLLKYELINIACSWIPGAFGVFLRSKLYPLIIKNTGRNVIFGSNVVIRHPRKIRIGNNVVIDDNCVLDAKGSSNRGIFIGENVFIGRNTILSCKNGDIEIRNNTNISFNCAIYSASSVEIEENVLVAAYTFFIGGGHTFTEKDKPVIEQESISKGIKIGKNSWIGADVSILDGVTIGKDVIIGAGAVVTKDIPNSSIAAGVPAKVIKNR